MVPASVGFQCPECVAGGRASGAARRGRRYVPVGRHGNLVTRGLLVACVAVFVLQHLAGTGASGLDRITERFAMDPLAIAQDHQVERLLTPMFLHASVLHIAFNMLALISFGSAVEGRLGRARFLAVYVVAGLAGNVTSFVLAPPGTISVGASTSLFGLFGAYAVLARQMRADTSQVLGLIAVNLVLTFAIPTIDWRGHVGGLVGGTLAALVLVAARRLPTARLASVAQGVGLALLVVLACAAAAVRVHQLGG